MTADVELWPLLALPANLPWGTLAAIALIGLLAIVGICHGRRHRRAALRRDIERHSHDRPEAVHDPEEER